MQTSANKLGFMQVLMTHRSSHYFLGNAFIVDLFPEFPKLSIVDTTLLRGKLIR